MASVKGAMDDSDILRNVPGEEGVDAFDNDPTRLCSLKDEKNFIFESYNIGSHEEWQEVVLALTMQTYTFCRGSEFRGIRLPFLRIDTSDIFAPFPDGPMNSCLINLRNPNSTKTNIARKTVIGGWRHREYYRCFISHLSFKMLRIFSLKSENEIFEYFLLQDDQYHKSKKFKDKTKPPFYHDFLSCWENRVIFNDTDDLGSRKMRDSFKRYSKMINLTRSRTSYFRGDGMVRAMNNGSLKENITLLSGHIVNKDVSDHSYFSALNKNICHSNSGFEQSEEYFVACIAGTYLKIQSLYSNSFQNHHGNENLYTKWTNLLFPCLARFKERFKIGAPEGRVLYDRLSAKEFVGETLPFYAKVIIEDGVMWIVEHPDHMYSQVLREHLGPEYIKFSQECYQSIINLQHQFDLSHFSRKYT